MIIRSLDRTPCASGSITRLACPSSCRSMKCSTTICRISRSGCSFRISSRSTKTNQNTLSSSAGPECTCRVSAAWPIGKPSGSATCRSSVIVATGTESFPRQRLDRSEQAVKTTFNQFFGTITLYDLTRQWILKDGPFVCDFAWISETYDQSRAEARANDIFKTGLRSDTGPVRDCSMKKQQNLGYPHAS